MNRRCLAPSVQEINDSNCSIQNLSYELEYANKRGKPLKAIIFTWDKVIGETTKKVTDITTESVYHTVKETLREHPEFKDEDIISIARAAKKNEITDIQVKQRISYVLKRENILNPVGYIVALMQKFNDAVEVKNKLNQFNNFEQRKYDYDELEKVLLDVSLPKLEPKKSDIPTERLSDIVRAEEKDPIINEKPDFIVTNENEEQYRIDNASADDEVTKERLKKLMDIMKNTSDKD